MKHSEVVQPDYFLPTSLRVSSVHCLPGELWECAKTLNTCWVFVPSVLSCFRTGSSGKKGCRDDDTRLAKCKRYKAQGPGKVPREKHNNSVILIMFLHF